MSGIRNELIIIEGKKAPMFTCPKIPEDDSRIIETKHDIYATDCTRGYIGTWKIENKKLYLISFEGLYKLLDDTPVFANWVSQTLVVPRGKIIDSYARYFPIYEYDLHLTIENGLVIKRQTFKNSKKVNYENIFDRYGFFI